MKRLAFLFFLSALPLFGQSNSGELRLKVTDPAGLGVKATVRIISEANQYRNALVTTDQGFLVVQRLPYGIYQLEIAQPGFATVSEASKFVPPSPGNIDPAQAPFGESIDICQCGGHVD